MSDEILSELLERSVADVSPADPPLAELLARGRAVRRSRRRTTVVGAVLACLLVIGGVGVLRWVERPEAPSVSTSLPTPPSGTKWVGVGRQVVAVPASWPVFPNRVCGGPGTPFVTVLDTELLRHAFTCALPLQPVPRHVTISSGQARSLNASGATVHATLPPDWRAIPVGRPDPTTGDMTTDRVVSALEAAGFQAEVRAATTGSMWAPVTTDPAMGTPARIGSTVVVYDHGKLPSTARLTGTLSWVGGPAPGSPQPHFGWLHVLNDDRSFEQLARTESDGSWSLDVPPGTYTVLGTSPGYLSRAGKRDACSSEGKITVAAHQTVPANVYCQLY
ncbi:hypothetical protein GCM10028801_03420 [Nocardioides maradonensis]